MKYLLALFLGVLGCASDPPPALEVDLLSLTFDEQINDGVHILNDCRITVKDGKEIKRECAALELWQELQTPQGNAERLTPPQYEYDSREQHQ